MPKQSNKHLFLSQACQIIYFALLQITAMLNNQLNFALAN